MARIRLTVAYVGTRYHGWQIQKNGPSIQEALETRISYICGVPVRVHGSGRTDAGVHATGQVAHFDAPDGNAIPWQKALNSMLPEDIAVVDARAAEPGFHARFSAVSKRYAYTLWTDPRFVLPQRAPFVWSVRGLNLEAMDRAAALLAGTHDFASFQNAGTELKTTIRTLEPIIRVPGLCSGEWILHFQADGFLKQMVRNLTAFLVEVGRGRLCPEDGPRLFRTRDRRLAPATAPPQGLCLEEVFYGEPPV